MRYLGATGLYTIYPDLDAFGHVNNVHYPRYIDQGRIEVLQKAGIDPEKLKERGRRLQLVSIETNFLFPLRHGEEIEVHTYLCGFEGESIEFWQEIIAARNDRCVFSAMVKCQVTDSTGRPINPAADWFGAIEAERLRVPKTKPQERLMREFHKTSANAENIEKKRVQRQLVTRFHEMDTSGSINHAVYFSYFEEGRWAMFLCGDNLVHDLRGEKGLILGSQLVLYRQPVSGGESLTVNTGIHEVGRASVICRHTLEDVKGAVRAEAIARVISIETRTGRPTAWPDELRNHFSDLAM